MVRVLRLEERLSSQTIRASDKIKLFTRTSINLQQPWLPRKVLVDDNGNPIAIGIPKGPPRERKADGPEGVILSAELRRDKPSIETVAEGKSPPEVVQPYTVVRIFYGTDRSGTHGGTGYTNRRDSNGALHYGTCDVAIPRIHKLAKLESPHWWKFEFRWNPEKYITLQHMHEVPERIFHSMLHDYISKTTDPSAFIFIHGFNVSFEDAARRTAQLTYDLGFVGAPILYSWPSANSVSGYLADEAMIEWTKPHLTKFLSQIVHDRGISKLHVVAHSMGNCALVKILPNLPATNGLPFFNQIVLTAPDIDTGEFLHLAASMQSAGARTTLYASSNDKAIQLSTTLHQYPRAGESGKLSPV